MHPHNESCDHRLESEDIRLAKGKAADYSRDRSEVHYYEVYIRDDHPAEQVGDGFCWGDHCYGGGIEEIGRDWLLRDERRIPVGSLLSKYLDYLTSACSGLQPYREYVPGASRVHTRATCQMVVFGW